MVGDTTPGIGHQRKVRVVKICGASDAKASIPVVVLFEPPASDPVFPLDEAAPPKQHMRSITSQLSGQKARHWVAWFISAS